MPRSTFDPYASLTPEERAELKKNPAQKERRLPRHEVRGGQVFRAGRSDPIPTASVRVGRTRHSRRVVELDRQIAALQAERQQHLDQAAHLDEILSDVE
jgi:hypothetical protein